MSLPIGLLITCAATIVIEYGVLALLGEKRRKVLLSSVVINILTNIPLNLFLLYVYGGATAIFVGELIVIIVEALWYYHFVRDIKQATTYSLLCNAISFLLGLLVQLVYIYVVSYQ